MQDSAWRTIKKRMEAQTAVQQSSRTAPSGTEAGSLRETIDLSDEASPRPRNASLRHSYVDDDLIVVSPPPSRSHAKETSAPRSRLKTSSTSSDSRSRGPNTAQPRFHPSSDLTERARHTLLAEDPAVPSSGATRTQEDQRRTPPLEVVAEDDCQLLFASLAASRTKRRRIPNPPQPASGPVVELNSPPEPSCASAAASRRSKQPPGTLSSGVALSRSKSSSGGKAAGSKGSGSAGVHLLCAVCLSGLEAPTSTVCGHVFCRECILACIRKQRCCPICRRPLRSSQVHQLFLSSAVEEAEGGQA